MHCAIEASYSFLLILPAVPDDLAPFLKFGLVADHSFRPARCQERYKAAQCNESMDGKSFLFSLLLVTTAVPA